MHPKTKRDCDDARENDMVRVGAELDREAPAAKVLRMVPVRLIWLDLPSTRSKSRAFAFSPNAREAGSRGPLSKERPQDCAVGGADLRLINSTSR